MKKEKSLSFLWRPFSKHFGNQKQILTHLTWEDYRWIRGFRVDEREDEDGPIQADKTLDNYNV
jgi:hypothetical protein